MDSTRAANHVAQPFKLNPDSKQPVRILSSKIIARMATDHLGADVLRTSRVMGATTGYVPGAGYGFGLGFGVRLADGEASNAGSAGDYSGAF